MGQAGSRWRKPNTASLKASLASLEENKDATEKLNVATTELETLQALKEEPE